MMCVVFKSLAAGASMAGDGAKKKKKRRSAGFPHSKQSGGGKDTRGDKRKREREIKRTMLT